MTDQLAMFEVPDAARPLLPAERIFPAEATWTPWRGAHKACEVCGRLALQMGVQKAPAVAPARWRRKGPNGDMYVCSPHQGELKPADDAVKARLTAMRELAAHKARGRPRY